MLFADGTVCELTQNTGPLPPTTGSRPPSPQRQGSAKSASVDRTTPAKKGNPKDTVPV